MWKIDGETVIFGGIIVHKCGDSVKALDSVGWRYRRLGFDVFRMLGHR